mgnify:CR=1 FL=1
MIVIAEIDASPLDVAAHLTAVADPTAGATAVFVGTVRDHDPGAEGAVVRLEYSSHPDAGEIIVALATEADRPDLRIAITHRIGDLAVGDVAIVCAVSSAHRAEAFDVSRALVERVKVALPIWKRQVTADGEGSWVGL